MPDLILENVPQDWYGDLVQAAEAHQRSVAEEVVARLRPVRNGHRPDEPIITDEIPAAYTIPLPGPGKPVKTRPGRQHLPDPPWITTGDR